VASQVVDLGNEIEHLIIDGGSKDGSVEILKARATQFPHIRWISEPDSGQSSAMNKGLRMARGNWVGFLNADDFYEGETLKKVLAIIKPCSRIRLIVGNLNVLDSRDHIVSVCKPSGLSLPFVLADIGDWPYNPSSYFYPLKVHDKIGLFDENEHFAMDYDFILRLLLAEIPVEYYNEIWGNFRLQPEAKTVSDLNNDSSYGRAEKLRVKYKNKAGNVVRFMVLWLSVFWKIRNKLLGTYRNLFR